ncbi:MAG TPA: hypothetical protein VJP80_02940 [Candidatus Saccharimonadales bacterium]|nr:hypothetical protein [Candidatus Saccharimonadales bacterium]
MGGAEHHKDRLGSGNLSNTFALRVGNETVAVRLCSDPYFRPWRYADTYLEGYLAAPGLPQHEQFLANGEEYDEAALVSELIAGTDLTHITPENLSQVTHEQLGTFIDALIIGSQTVEHDPNPGNYMYDPYAAFKAVDYHSRTRDGVPERLEVTRLAQAISGASIPLGYWPQTAAGRQTLRDRREASIPVLQRMIEVCEGQFTGETSSHLTTSIEQQITLATTYVAEYDRVHDW